jgi:hypothetical protein
MKMEGECFMSETMEIIERFERSLLQQLLSHCKPEQVDFFNRLYGSVDEIPLEKIPRAFEQCEATIKNNGDEVKFSIETGEMAEATVSHYEDRTKHLCDVCDHEYPACNPPVIEFGEGRGNDNVITCSRHIGLFTSEIQRINLHQYLDKVLNEGNTDVEIRKRKFITE